MFKKFILTTLSFFYCANIASSNQLINNSDEQTKTLLSIKNGIDLLSINSSDKLKFNNIIKKYLDSNKSTSSYLLALKELKKTLTTSKNSCIYSFLLSIIVSLTSGAIIYNINTPSSSNFIEPINEDDIKNGENLYSELKKIVDYKKYKYIKPKERTPSNKQFFIEKNDIEKLNEIFCNIENSSWSNKLQEMALADEKDSIQYLTKEINFKKAINCTDTVQGFESQKKDHTKLYNFIKAESIFKILNYFDPSNLDFVTQGQLRRKIRKIFLNLEELLDDAKQYNNTYYSRIKYSLGTGLTMFTLFYSLMTYENHRINNVEKLIDEAIKNTELTLNTPA